MDRKHIEDKLPASSRTNQAIKYSWQNYTNVKCRFIFASSAVKRICFPQEHIQLTVVFFRFHLYSCATCRKYFLQEFSLKINQSRCSWKFKLCTILQYNKSYKQSTNKSYKQSTNKPTTNRTNQNFCHPDRQVGYTIISSGLKTFL